MNTYLYLKMQKKEFFIWFFIVVSSLFLLCASITGIGSLYIDFFAMAVFFSVFIAMYISMPEILLKYLYFILGAVWSVVAVFMLENGNVVLRGKHSEHVNSLPLYVLSWIVFFFVIYHLERKNKRKLSRSIVSLNYQERELSKTHQKTINYVSMLLIAVVAACFMLVVRNPYFVLGIDRFVYNQKQIPAIIPRLIPWLYAFIPIVLMTRKNKKWIVYSYCIIFGLLLIWIGEKFTGIIMLFYMIIISMNPAYVTKQLTNKIRQIAKTAVIVVAAFLIIVYIQQVVLYGVDFDGFLNYLFDRVAAQGELWWLAFQQDNGKGAHIAEIWDEISILIFQPSGEMTDYNFGIYKMMWKFMNKDWVGYALAYGARATESTRVTFFYYGKYVGLFLGQAGLGALVYYVVNKCIIACNRTKMLQSVLWIYILRNLIVASSMSDFQLLTSKRSLLVYAILIILSHFTIHKNRNIAKEK